MFLELLKLVFLLPGLVGNSSFKNEVYPFIDSLRELHLSDSSIEFIWVNRKCNFVVHDLASVF